MDAADEERRAALLTALAAVRTRIVDAALSAGRDPRSVTMIAVTKTYPVSDVVALATLGVRDLGESREQEASTKVADLAALADAAGATDPASAEHDALAALRWHFVGQLQSRKARTVAAYAHAVHSVDRAALPPRLADGAEQAGRGPADPLRVFVQVNLDTDADADADVNADADARSGRGGARPADVAALADAVASRDALLLAGVMAVAPRDADPVAAFARLQEISVALRRDHPGADAISAGMSNDLEAAIAHGATHVRVGTALLGRREPVVG